MKLPEIDWRAWTKPEYVVGAAFLLALFAYQYSGRTMTLLDRPYGQCPPGEIFFESNSFGYSLCLPGSWEGQYLTENRDRTIYFTHPVDLGEGFGARALLFALTIVPEAHWHWSDQARLGRTILAKDSGRVLALIRPEDDPNSYGEKYKKMRDEVAGTVRTLAFADWKSIERVIEDYLEAGVVRRERGGQPFAAFEIIGREEADPGYRYFVWLYGEEYVTRPDGSAERAAVTSVPVAVTVVPYATGFRAAGFEAPRGGEEFWEDLRRIFPARVGESEWFLPDRSYLDSHVLLLRDVIRSKAKMHFGPNALAGETVN